MARGYCVWEPRAGEAFRRAVEKSVEVRELTGGIVRLFTGLWSSCVKASRASLALRVFPDLGDEELEVLSLVDAYGNLLDDLVDLECVDRVRGADARALYVRIVLLANRLMEDDMVREFLRGLGPRMVFDAEYKFRQVLSRQGLPHNEFPGILEELYTGQAYDATPGSSSPTQPAADYRSLKPRYSSRPDSSSAHSGSS